MGETVVKAVVLDVREGGCGHFLAMPKARWDYLYETGANMWCPYGDVLSWKDTENTRLKRQLAEAQEYVNREASRATSEATARRIAETELHKFTKRVEAGVCPHCHRTFQQLARHMKSKHLE